MWVAFALQKLLTFFQHICVSLDVNFNESLTNDVVSFEQLGPGVRIFRINTTSLFLVYGMSLFKEHQNFGYVVHLVMVRPWNVNVAWLLCGGILL